MKLSSSRVPYLIKFPGKLKKPFTNANILVPEKTLSTEITHLGLKNFDPKLVIQSTKLLVSVINTDS